MAAFFTRLHAEEAENSDDGIYILTAPLNFYSDVLREMIVAPTGFQTDFATVPRWPFIYFLFGNTCTEPAVIHDYEYSYQHHTRRQADNLFFEASTACRVKWWRKYPMWLAVRCFGWIYWNHPHPENPKQ